MSTLFADKDQLHLANDEEETAFMIATYQAVENNETEFLFGEYIVDTDHAVDAVLAIKARHTYH